MSAYDKIAALDHKSRSALEGSDSLIGLARNSKPEGKHARRQHNADLAGIGRTASQHLHKLDVLGRAASELTPASLEHLASALSDHNDAEAAIKSLPAHHRSGPVGVLVREFHAPGGPLGHKLPQHLEDMLSQILDEVAR